MILLTPGPLTTSATTREALLTDHGSRDPAFVRIVAEIRRRLEELLDPSGAFTCVPLQGSGTYAVEAMVAAFVPVGGAVLVGVNGAYGARIAEMARRLGRRVVEVPADEVHPIDPQAVARALDADPDLSHVAIVAVETTSGLQNPVEAVARVAAERGRRVLVDAMAAFGAVPVSGADPVDAVAASSNKCLEGVPGLAFVLARRTALAEARGGHPSLSLDLLEQHQRLEADGQFRFTPPTHVIAALHQALLEHEAEGGVAGRGARYRENLRVLVGGLRELGFRTLLPDAVQAPIIVTVEEPRDRRWSFPVFYEAIRERGFSIYPGKVTVRPTFRVGCIGRVYPEDLARFVAAAGEALDGMGLVDR